MEIIEVRHEIETEHNGKHSDLILTNANVVTRSECFIGTVKVVGGLIADISHGVSSAAGSVDMEGDYLLPGIIDVHTDHFEKQIMPRAGMTWNSLGATVAHDVQICAAGITTVFDSLIVGAVGDPERRRLLPLMLEGLDEAREHGLLRAEHLLHLRCDLREPDLLEQFLRYADRPELRFVTVMDDSASRDVERFRYRERRKNVLESEIEAQIEAAPMSAHIMVDNRVQIVTHCREANVPFASHDDTTAEHIAEAAAFGARISEFPITMESATAARAAGMAIIAGGPNLVAGRSHVNNVSVRELARNKLIDIICSDYIPGSLLRAIWHLTGENEGLSIPEAVSLGTWRPAEAFGLRDRGEIALGKRADLIRVADWSGPVVREAWVHGERRL
ncbi:alpha-D-ribose 1-methylphosphonate 5-triphosphate diphosphatase [Burkholderia cepacia]|uniref:alpha-D-ribose 1-methylphosphonate 5-triphosphate diphosphatase n=1 Tax=Burkholderia cepacia TaxID=292 RepID=UPI002AB63B61|nr:alpha-D-ribose 1-methylphosphonate 5-triphosphate diphosphatase [Burkholderia cepacia]